MGPDSATCKYLQTVLILQELCPFTCTTTWKLDPSCQGSETTSGNVQVVQSRKLPLFGVLCSCLHIVGFDAFQMYSALRKLTGTQVCCSAFVFSVHLVKVVSTTRPTKGLAAILLHPALPLRHIVNFHNDIRAAQNLPNSKVFRRLRCLD